MTDAEDKQIALERLERFAQSDSEPTLSETELEDILDESVRAVRWTTVTALAIGATVLPTVYNGHVYQVVTAGTTAATEPVWPESQSGTVTSGTVEFEEVGLYFYSSLYDVRDAIRKCWELKAAKASELNEGGETAIYDHCQEMKNSYSTPLIA